MEELWLRFSENLAGRLGGPLNFRFLLQPLMAATFALLDGLADAKAHRPAYFWALASSRGHRRELLRDGWKHFGKIFILAIILDLIYQRKVHRTIYPLETLVVALALAVMPYVLLRGPVNRAVQACRRTGTPSGSDEATTKGVHDVLDDQGTHARVRGQTGNNKAGRSP